MRASAFACKPALLITHAALIVVGASPPTLMMKRPLLASIACDRRVKRAHRAVAFGVALQRQHELMTIDDARLRREHRFDTFERGFERLRLVAGDSHQVEHAVVDGLWP